VDNKAQTNARRLLRILTEDKYIKRRAPFIISVGVVAIVLMIVSFYRNTHATKEQYLIGREDKLNFKDIDGALKSGINFEELGKEKKHILFYLGAAPYSLEVLSYLKKSGVNLKSYNSNNHNALEDILLNLDLDPEALEESFYTNISTLLSLDLSVSTEVLKEASKKCETTSLSTCLKIAFYYKAINKTNHARSYGMRACYTSKENPICALAQRNILGE